jgi:hypothetical protein
MAGEPSATSRVTSGEWREIGLVYVALNITASQPPAKVEE